MSRFTMPGIATALLFFVAACSGGTGPTDAPTPTLDGLSASVRPSMVAPSSAVASLAPGSISIKEFEFTPARLTVHAGDMVTWTNEEDSLHTATSGTPDARSGLFDSSEFDTGETFEFTFSEVGTFPFFCDRHEFMRGEVIVVP